MATHKHGSLSQESAYPRIEEAASAAESDLEHSQEQQKIFRELDMLLLTLQLLGDAGQDADYEPLRQRVSQLQLLLEGDSCEPS